MKIQVTWDVTQCLWVHVIIRNNNNNNNNNNKLLARHSCTYRMIRIFSHTAVETSGKFALQHTCKFIMKLHVHIINNLYTIPVCINYPTPYFWAT